MTLQEIDWVELGTRLRESADDAFETTPSLDSAYLFLLENPDLFSDGDEWPAGMPTRAPEALDRAYRRMPERTTPAALSNPSTTAGQDQPTPENDYLWIKIGIRQTKYSDGWDLLCGEDKSRDVSGVRASHIMYAYCDECLDALQSVIDQAEPATEPEELDSEDESERWSGTPEHRSIG